MKKITKEDLKTSARSVMIDMSEDEYDSFLLDINSFENNLDIIEKFKIDDNVSPMPFPYDFEADLVENNNNEKLNKDEAFSNSKCYKDGKIIIGKVIK